MLSELLFILGCWSAKSKVPARYSALWLACWTGVTDKSRNSKSSEVRRVWEVCEEQLQRVPRVWRDHIAMVLGAGDVSEAWRIWSLSAEVSFVRTCLLTGGPASACGLEVGRGAAAFREVALGGPVPLCSLPSPVRCEGGEFFVHLYEDRSGAGLVKLEREVKCVCDVLDAIDRHGVTLSRNLELGRRWESLVRSGPLVLVGWDDLVVAPDTGLSVFSARIRMLGWALSCMRWLCMDGMHLVT